VIGGLLMPIVFVLLFGYVFGSSIQVRAVTTAPT
jgi:hypothetical protein